MNSLAEPPADPQTKLPARIIDCEHQLLACLLSRPPENPERQADRCLYIIGLGEGEMSGHTWYGTGHRDIFGAMARLAAQYLMPAGKSVADEMERASNPAAAKLALQYGGEYPNDSETPYWAERLRKLSRDARLYASAAAITGSIDAGQSLEDLSPMLADLQSAATPADTDTLIHAADLLAENPPLAEPVIDGALRRGEVGLLIGAPKTCKSWAVLHLHCAVATGGSWLGHRCRKGRSLLIDGELTPPVIGHRLAKVVGLYGLTDCSSIDILPLRGDPRDIDRLEPRLRKIKPGDYDLVTIDPVFKLLPSDADENSNAYVAGFYRKIIEFAGRSRLAVACVHHASKGAQAGKTVSDMGAGGGAQSRSVDWHAALREHTEPGCVSLHTICRSFASTPPSVWRMEPPEIVPMAELDPEDLRTARPRKAAAEPTTEKPTPPNWQSIAALANGEAHDLPWFSARLNLGSTKTRELLGQAVAMGSLHLWERDKKRGLPARWAREPERLV